MYGGKEVNTLLGLKRKSIWTNKTEKKSEDKRNHRRELKKKYILSENKKENEIRINDTFINWRDFRAS